MSKEKPSQDRGFIKINIARFWTVLWCMHTKRYKLSCLHTNHHIIPFSCQSSNNHEFIHSPRDIKAFSLKDQRNSIRDIPLFRRLINLRFFLCYFRSARCVSGVRYKRCTIQLFEISSPLYHVIIWNLLLGCWRSSIFGE